MNVHDSILPSRLIVDWHKRDQYGRLIGVVIAFGDDIDLEQVRAGMAWWYRNCAKEQSDAEREIYGLAEQGGASGGTRIVV